MSPDASFPVDFVQRANVLRDGHYVDGIHYARKGLVRGEGQWLKNDDGKVGALWFVCPCGCHTIQAITVDPPGWHWNGDTEKPTCTPSIQILHGCDYHGFLTDGKWILA